MKALLLLFLFGTQLFRWEAVQIGAWNAMIRDQLKTKSLAEAVDTALSGKAPCALCHQITRGQTQPDEEETLLAHESPENPVILPTEDFPHPSPPPRIISFPPITLCQNRASGTPELPPPKHF